MAFLGHVLGQLSVLAVLLAVAWAVGRLVTRRLGGVPAGLTLAMGLALGAQALLLLGLVGALRLGGIGVLGGLGLGAWLWRSRWLHQGGPRRAALDSATSEAGWRAPAARRSAVGLAVVFLAPAFALTLYPPLGFDQTLYHLPFTQAFAASGAVPFLPDLRFPVFPQLAEILATPLFLVGGDTATQLVGFGALLGCLALCRAWVDERAPRAGWLAPAILVGSPGVLYLATCGYVEPLVALFGLGALYAADRGRPEQEPGGWLLVSGFLAGSAAGVKYLGLLFPPAAALLLLSRDGRRANLGRLAAFGFAALVALAPSYGRIVAHTGNPLFPFFPDAFGESPWAADSFLGPRGIERLVESATLLWDLTFDRAAAGGFPPFSPAFLLGLPLVALAAVRQPGMRRLTLMATGCLLLSPTHGHYFLAFAPLWAVVVALAAEALVGPTSRRTLAAAAIALALFGPAWACYRLARLGPPPSSAPEREALLLRELPAYPALSFLNREANGEPVYGIGAENLVAFSRGPLLGDHNGPRSFSRFETRFEELGSLAAVLDEWRIRHLLVSRRAPKWLARAEADPRLEPIFTDGGAVVFRVDASRDAPEP